jgi:hypothetical protein
MTENKEHDKLFADLDALNEQHTEVGLAAGVWKVQVRALVQHYLYDLKLKRVEAAADRLTEMEKAMRLAVGEAIKAKTRASAALIIAVGAMVAAMAGALSRSSLCGNMVASRPGDGLACTLLATEKHPERNIRSPPPFGVFHSRFDFDLQRAWAVSIARDCVCHSHQRPTECRNPYPLFLKPERCAGRRQRGEGPLHADVAESRPRSRHLLMARRRRGGLCGKSRPPS